MVNCQKYFSIISESSQILRACFRSPTDGQGHTDFPDKEMNEPSQLSHFLQAHEKNESQPHCYGEEGSCAERSGFCCWKNGLGNHSLAYMYSEDTVILSIPCLATVLTSRPNCQPARPGHQGTATEWRAKKLFSMPSFRFLSSLATADHHKTSASLSVTAKQEETVS